MYLGVTLERWKKTRRSSSNLEIPRYASLTVFKVKIAHAGVIRLSNSSNARAQT